MNIINFNDIKERTNLFCEKIKQIKSTNRVDIVGRIEFENFHYAIFNSLLKQLNEDKTNEIIEFEDFDVLFDDFSYVLASIQNIFKIIKKHFGIDNNVCVLNVLDKLQQDSNLGNLFKQIINSISVNMIRFYYSQICVNNIKEVYYLFLKLYVSLIENIDEIIIVLNKGKYIKNIKTNFKIKEKSNFHFYGFSNDFIKYVFNLNTNNIYTIKDLINLNRLLDSKSKYIFYDLYEELTGKGIFEFYREFVYKKDFCLLLNNIESLNKTIMFESKFIDIFGVTHRELIKKCILENGNYQNIIKIIRTIANSTKLVHNYSDVFLLSSNIKNNLWNIYVSGQAGVFKFDIINDFLYVKSIFINTYSDDFSSGLDFAIKNKLIIREKLDKTFNDFNKIKTLHIDTKDYNTVKLAKSFVKIISDSIYMFKLETQRKDKNRFLFNLNCDIDKNIKFIVLKDKDPLHFTIGVETNCCQRIGGFAEDSVVDSYINKNAGVLVLYIDNKIVAQSYFHYVPKDNGIILDNVESNDNRMRHLAISQDNLDEIYAKYAREIVQKLKLSYVRCGIGHNGLSNKAFAGGYFEKDPREFKSEKIYTDFKPEKHLDLLKFNAEH